MATQASEQLAVRVCDGTISAARKRTSSVHYRTVARAVERKDMAPHQTFYLKADRSLPESSRECRLGDIHRKGDCFRGEARAVKGQREDASGVIKDKDERYFYVRYTESGGRHRDTPELAQTSNQAN